MLLAGLICGRSSMMSLLSAVMTLLIEMLWKPVRTSTETSLEVELRAWPEMKLESPTYSAVKAYVGSFNLDELVASTLLVSRSFLNGAGPFLVLDVI